MTIIYQTFESHESCAPGTSTSKTPGHTKHLQTINVGPVRPRGKGHGPREWGNHRWHTKILDDRKPKDSGTEGSSLGRILWFEACLGACLCPKHSFLLILRSVCGPSVPRRGKWGSLEEGNYSWKPRATQIKICFFPALQWEMTEIEGVRTGVILRRNLSSLLLFCPWGHFNLVSS